jgi:DUF4097 and DUF4098 domain-containing protein YvlB
MWSVHAVGAAADAVRDAFMEPDDGGSPTLRVVVTGEADETPSGDRVPVRVAALVPAGSNVVVRTSTANVIARGDFEALSATTRSGRVSVRGRSTHVTASTGSGAVDLRGARFATVVTRAGALSSTGTREIQATTMAGHIHAHDFGGYAELRTVAGDITVHATHPGRLIADSTSGDISLSAETLPLLDHLDARLATTSGTVHLPPVWHLCGRSAHRCRRVDRAGADPGKSSPSPSRRPRRDDGP